MEGQANSSIAPLYQSGAIMTFGDLDLKCINFGYFSFYEQDKFHAQLS